MVSVVIPTHNRASLLRDAVGSAQGQTLAPGEILVVDDGSTDDSRRVGEGLAGVSYVYQDNQGPSAARNRGLTAARGEFVAFLDSDDTWDADFLSTLVGFLGEHPDTGFVFANWRGIDAAGRQTYPDYMATRAYYRGVGVAHGADWRLLASRQARALFIEHSAAPSSSLVVRRDRAVAWDATVRIGEDNLFLLDVLIRHGCGCAFTARPLWSKRCSTANLFDGNQNAGELARQHLAMTDALLCRHGVSLGRAERRQMRKSRACDLYDWAYWEACHGHRWAALALYRRSFLTSPSWRCLKAAAMLPGVRNLQREVTAATP